jgi:hypothetical protein
MTRTELERIAVIEQKVDGVELAVNRIEGKLDSVIRDKADRSDVAAICEDIDANRSAINLKADATDFRELRNLLIGVLVAVAGTAITVLIGIMGYVANAYLVGH